MEGGRGRERKGEENERRLRGEEETEQGSQKWANPNRTKPSQLSTLVKEYFLLSSFIFYFSMCIVYSNLEEVEEEGWKMRGNYSCHLSERSESHSFIIKDRLNPTKPSQTKPNHFLHFKFQMYIILHRYF